MLSADIPDLQVDWGIWRRKGDGGDILADGGHRLQIGVRGRVGALYLFEERGFPGVVEAEEEDGVLCRRKSASLPLVRIALYLLCLSRGDRWT